MDLQLTFPRQLSQHLRSLRKAHGLSQVQLAARLGVTQSRVAALEKDASKLSVDQLCRVLSTLNAGITIRTDLKVKPQESTVAHAIAETDPKGQW